MCHACLLGDRKYVHELPDPTSLIVKTDDLINGRYEWDPEYVQGYELGGGIIISEEDIREREMFQPVADLIHKEFPLNII